MWRLHGGRLRYRGGCAEPLLKASELKSVKDIFGQIINLQGEKKYRENLRNTDVLIKVDVTGYSAASFTKEAIDTLMVRGERAAWTVGTDCLP